MSASTPSRKVARGAGRTRIDGLSSTPHAPAAADWQVYAAIALDDVPAERVKAIHADDQLWPAKCIGGFVRNVYWEVPYQQLVMGCVQVEGQHQHMCVMPVAAHEGKKQHHHPAYLATLVMPE